MTLFSKIYYGPPDWLIEKFNQRARRAFGFWVVVFATLGAFFWGTQVLYVTILSVIALIPNYSTETPVEIEDD